MDETQIVQLIKALEDIRDRPPNMYGWKKEDAWYTAANQCIVQVKIATNKIGKKL